MEDFEYAKDKVLMGVERKTMVLSDEEKEITAYHEAGHALVAVFTPEADPLHKVTIIPRGRALGLTMQLPTDDQHTYKKKYVEAQIAILMGGRVAEELTQDDITTGAGNDIDRATDLARQMVCDWGMSSLGPLSFGANDEPVFLGRDFQNRAEYSDETARRIDAEVEQIVQRGHVRATDILSEHRSVLDHLATELLEREVLEGDEVYDIILEMTGRDLKPVRARLREAKDREQRKPAPAPGRARKSAKSPGEADGYPGSPEPAPASRSGLVPRRHPTSFES
jgi:cell division protease FtsH